MAKILALRHGKLLSTPLPLTGQADAARFFFSRTYMLSPLFASGRQPIRLVDEVMQVSCQLRWSRRSWDLQAIALVVRFKGA